MENFFDPFIILILFTQILKFSASMEGSSDCPMDCICYSEYLSNLANWKWIDEDIHLNSDDPEHDEFNPYTEHNEVYDNPNVAKLLREDPLRTVTCIIREDSSVGLSRTFREIPSSTQVLSLLQGAGSGNVTLGKEHFEGLRSLIGIEIQGYTKQDEHSGSGANSFRLEADAFVHLHKLTYLNLENVVLQQRSLENHVTEYTSEIVKITRVVANNTFNSDDEDIMNELESQLMFISPNGKREEGIIVPYNEYKMEVAKSAKSHPVPIEPKVAVAFTNIPSLIHLRISQCNMQDMSWDMFYKLHNLKYLLLEKNDLLFLPDFAFYSTSNLTALSLSGNRILSLQTVGLAGLLYLQKLDMTNNNITHLSELSLPPFPRLEVADFRFNPIETIFPSTFEIMNTTKTLYLGNPTVPLTFIPNSFYGLVSLTKLDIVNVRISFLERPMLKGIPQLKHLIMNGHIRKISYDAFSEVSKLETLILKNCGIEKISMDAFYGLTSLIELELSNNKLTFLPPGIFEDQVSLREIYLQHNQLTTLAKHMFIRTPAKLIRLEGNPWHCSCEMTNWNPYIVNKVKRYHIPRNNTSTFCQMIYDKGSMCNQEFTGFKVKYVYEKRVSPMCATPNKFSKRSVFEVVRKEFRHCYPSTPSTVLPMLFNMKTKSGKPVKPVKPTTNIYYAKTKKKNIKSEVVRTAEQLVKEQEKLLLTSNLKVKEIEEVPIVTAQPIIIPKHIEDELNSHPIIQAHINLPSSTIKSSPSTEEIMSSVTETSTEKSIPDSIITTDEPVVTTISPLPTSASTEDANFQVMEPVLITESSNVIDENSQPSLTNLTTTTSIPTVMKEIEISNQILTKTESGHFPLVPEKSSKQNSLGYKQKTRQPKQLGPPNTMVPPVSKKALKLAKLEKMDKLLRRRS